MKKSMINQVHLEGRIFSHDLTIKTVQNKDSNNFGKEFIAGNIEIAVDDSIVDYIAKVGFDDVYGARPLKRAVQSKIEDEFAEQILDGKIKEGDKVTLKAEEDKVIIAVK